MQYSFQEPNGVCRYHVRALNLDVANFLRHTNNIHFCILDFPKSQLKPPNLHKQNGCHVKGQWLILAISCLLKVIFKWKQLLYWYFLWWGIDWTNWHRLKIKPYLHKSNLVSISHRAKRCGRYIWYMYHMRVPTLSFTNLFEYRNHKYVCTVHYPRSQLKPDYLHKKMAAI